MTNRTLQKRSLTKRPSRSRHQAPQKHQISRHRTNSRLLHQAQARAQVFETAVSLVMLVIRSLVLAVSVLGGYMTTPMDRSPTSQYHAPQKAGRTWPTRRIYAPASTGHPQRKRRSTSSQLRKASTPEITSLHFTRPTPASRPL